MKQDAGSSIDTKKTSDKLKRKRTAINYNSSIQISKDGGDEEEDIEDQIILESEINHKNFKSANGNMNFKSDDGESYNGIGSSGHASVTDSLNLFEREKSKPYLVENSASAQNGYSSKSPSHSLVQKDVYDNNYISINN